MRVEGAVADVERLVVDKQADHLAIGHVDDRLAGLGVAVRRLRVGKRDLFVDAVEIAACDGVGLALVEVGAPADVAVGEGEEGFGLPEAVEIERRLADRPGPALEVTVLDHTAWSLSRSPRSRTTMSAPCFLSASAWWARSTPTTKPN